MFSMKKSFFAVAIVTAAISASAAQAAPGFKVGLMGGANYAMPKPSTGLTEKFGLSGGLSLGVGPLEVSALYSQYKIEAAGISITTNYLDVPVLFRMGAGPLSLGLGGFYSTFLDGSTSVGATVNGTANYGATGSLRVTVPVVGLFIDGRYNLGLKDDNGDKLSSAALYLGWNIL